MASQGRFKLLHQIGEGTQGVVYLARDTQGGGEVALKQLDASTAVSGRELEQVRRLFVGEAALPSHPGIAQILEIIEDAEKGEVFVAMEHVAGTSLAESLARPDPIPFDFVVNIVGALGDALDHMHAHGIVHRDVKPANILIDPSAGVKLTDFGISELRGEDLSADLKRAGSPSYMPPERILGTGSGPSSDIWALGVVLYELLTRRLPFEAESVGELMAKVASEPAVPLDAHGIAILPGLQPILDRVLAKEPEDRYPTAKALADALREVQLGQMSLSATLPAQELPQLEELIAAGQLELEQPQPRITENSDSTEVEPDSEPPESFPRSALEEPALGWAPAEIRDSQSADDGGVGPSASTDDMERDASPEARSAAATSQPVPWNRLNWRGLWTGLWTGKRRKVLLAAGIAGFVLLGLMSVGGSPPSADPLPQTGVEVARFEYLALLEEARGLLEAGETKAAADLFSRAERLSPDSRRIRALRDEARQQAEREVARELELEVAALVGIAEGEFEDGHLADAETTVERALELDSTHAQALTLSVAVADARRAASRQRRVRHAAAEVEVVTPEPAPLPPPVKIVTPPAPPKKVVVPAFADIRVDFYSELPRGVITVYQGDTQILRRPFRFTEKKGFMRSKGVSGGFDEEIRVTAGPSDFRIYLSLPGRETQVRRVSGILPGGTLRDLHVRVTDAGELQVGLR